MNSSNSNKGLYEAPHIRGAGKAASGVMKILRLLLAILALLLAAAPQLQAQVPPPVDFTWCLNANYPRQVSFTAHPYPVGNYNYFWTFGDGGTSTVPDPVHIYSSYGVKNVTLKLTTPGTEVTNVHNVNVVSLGNIGIAEAPILDQCGPGGLPLSASLSGPFSTINSNYKIRWELWNLDNNTKIVSRDGGISNHATGAMHNGNDGLSWWYVLGAGINYRIFIKLLEYEDNNITMCGGIKQRYYDFSVGTQPIDIVDIVLSGSGGCVDPSKPLTATTHVSSPCALPKRDQTLWHEILPNGGGNVYLGTGEPLVIPTPTSFPHTMTLNATVYDDHPATDTDSKTFTLYEKPTVSFQSSTIGLCPGHTLDLATQVSVIATNPASLSYTWTANPASALSWLSQTNVAAPTLTAPLGASSATFTLTVSNPVGGCESSGLLRVNPGPLLVEFDNVPPIVCETQPLDVGLKTVGGATPLAFDWSAFGVTCPPCPSISYTPAAGTNSYTTTVTDVTGCSATASITLESRQSNPQIMAGPDQTGCPLDPFTLASTTSGCTGNCLVNWQWLEAGQANSEPGNSIIVTPSATITYTAVVTDDYSNCKATDETQVDVGNIPVVTVNTKDDNNFCTGTAVILSATVNNTYGYQFQWIADNGHFVPPGLVVTNFYPEYTSYRLTAIHPVTGCALDLWSTPEFAVNFSGLTAPFKNIEYLGSELSTSPVNTCNNKKIAYHFRVGNIDWPVGPGTGYGVTWKVYRINQDGTGFKEYNNISYYWQEDPATCDHDQGPVYNRIIVEFSPDEFNNDNGQQQYYIEAVSSGLECRNKFHDIQLICYSGMDWQCDLDPGQLPAQNWWLPTYNQDHCNCNLSNHCDKVYVPQQNPDYSGIQKLSQAIVNKYWQRGVAYFTGVNIESDGPVNMTSKGGTWVAKTSIRLLPGFYAKADGNKRFHAYLDEAVCTSGSGKTTDEAADRNLEEDELLEDLGPGTYRVFPNPTSSVLNIEVHFDTPTDLHVTVFNPMGQVVFDAPSKGVLSRNFGLDLRDKSDGLYYVRLDMGSEVKFEKVIVTK